MVAFSEDKALRDAAAINDRAESLGLGWRLIRRGFKNGVNDVGLANWVIGTSDTAQHATDSEATEFVVGQCWAEGEAGGGDTLHGEAMDFLHRHAPESYVRAIYIGHQCDMPAAVSA